MGRARKEIASFSFVDHAELHCAGQAKILIDTAEALLNSGADPARDDEQVLFKGLHACGYALAHLENGWSVGRHTGALKAIYSRILNELMKRNEALIYEMRNKTKISRSLDPDDVASEGYWALYRSVVKFDPWRGFRFSTYSCTSIRRGFVRLVRERQKQFEIIGLMREHRTSSVFRPDKTSLVIGIKIEQVMRALNDNRAGLNDRERFVIEQRLLHHRDANTEILESIGKLFDVCRERVRQIEFNAVNKLRKSLGVAQGEVVWTKENQRAICA